LRSDQYAYTASASARNVAEISEHCSTSAGTASGGVDAIRYEELA
jgi:hypothetical protein